MSIRYITALLLAVTLFSCSAGGKKELVIGKSLDEATRKVKDVTDRYDVKDNFAFYLNVGKPFSSSVINVRFYKGNDVTDLVQCTSDDIKVNPKSSTLASSLQVEYFAGKSGNGKYFIYLIIDDTVIANKSFMVGPVEENKEPVVDRKPFTNPQSADKAIAPIAPNKGAVPNVPNEQQNDVFVPPVSSVPEE